LNYIGCQFDYSAFAYTAPHAHAKPDGDMPINRSISIINPVQNLQGQAERSHDQAHDFLSLPPYLLSNE
jgi:hypothetical protein